MARIPPPSHTHFEKTSDDIRVLYKNLGPALAYSLWDADEIQMTSILAGLMDSPIIVGVKVEDETLCNDFLFEQR